MRRMQAGRGSDPVIYARREKTTDPGLPDRVVARDVVLSLDQGFSSEAARFRWNDPERPVRMAGPGNRSITVNGQRYRLVWVADPD